MSTSLDGGSSSSGSGGSGAAFSLNHGPSAHPHHYVHAQRRHEGTKSRSGSKAKSSGSPPSISLVISPNLDALLAHDSEERLRSARPRSPESAHSGTGSVHLQQLASPGSSEGGAGVGGGGGGGAAGWGKDEADGEPAGLPPPPRRTGRGAGLRSPQTGRRATAAAAESPRRTPEREMAPKAEEEEERREGAKSANPYINRAPTLEDMLVVNARRASLESVGEAGTGRSRDARASWLHVSGRRARVPAAVDPRTPTSPAMSSDAGQRRRPLLSHGPQPSVSSIDSAGSTAPASTAEHEPRISISSTIYAASDSHSLPHSLYNQPPSARASFIDLYSPLRNHFHDDAASDTGPTSPIQFADPPADDRDHSRPPLPTTPKPVFARSGLKSRSRSPMPAKSTNTPPPTAAAAAAAAERPPTTNFLDMEDRADLIRKTRKLARVFGQTPGADAMAQQDANRVAAINPALRARAALALVDNTLPPHGPRRTPADGAYFVTANPRRHSMPLTPDDVSFISIVSPGFDNGAFPRTPPAQVVPPARAESPISFIDISDDEYVTAAARLAKSNSSAAAGTGATGTGVSALRSRVSMQSINTLSSDDLAEEDRRRKRERLAKLHRFLGSRVPAHLVLGLDPLDASSLPPPQASSESSGADDSPGTRKIWLKRRRSSSAVILPSEFRLDELERVKEELDDKEKAINVRRAHKMEKVFGVAPPQTLYHTRHCTTQRPLSAGDPTTSSSPSNPATGTNTPSSMLGALPSIPRANTNRASYLPKVRTKAKKSGRPGTAESSKQLIPKDGEDGEKERELKSPAPVDPRHSFVYTHYQHSLNSLGDILDRDDRASLVELHEYLNSTEIPTPTLTTPTTRSNNNNNNNTTTATADIDDHDESALTTALERRLSLAPSIKSERRRSLPARTSMISLAPSEFTVLVSPPVDAMDFQQRRRRAAKLTQFFGVNYRELIADVLESIESGVAHEGARGTLRAEEVEDLLTKLRTLKTKRTSLFS